MVDRHAAALLSAVLALACSESPTGSDPSGDAGGAGGVAGAAGAATGGGPPKITQVLVSGALDNDDKSVTLTVDVTDPDGLGDIVGGKLYSPDKSQFFGPFSQVSAGTFSASISWMALNGLAPVIFNLGGHVERSVLIEFSDTAGGVDSVEHALELSCTGCGIGCSACGKCTTTPGCDICDTAGATKTCGELCSSLGMLCLCSYPSCQTLTCDANACDSPCTFGTVCSCRCV